MAQDTGAGDGEDHHSEHEDYDTAPEGADPIPRNWYDEVDQADEDDDEYHPDNDDNLEDEIDEDFLCKLHSPNLFKSVVKTNSQ